MIIVIEERKIYIKLFSAKEMNNTSYLLNVLQFINILYSLSHLITIALKNTFPWILFYRLKKKKEGHNFSLISCYVQATWQF